MANFSLMTHGEKLKIIRTCMGSSKTELAKYLGCSVATISNYEQDKTPVTIDVLSKLHNIGVDPMLFFIDDPFNAENIADIKAVKEYFSTNQPIF